MDAILAPLHEHPLLARLEENRLRLYLEVLRMQRRLERGQVAQDRVIARLQRALEAAELENLRLRGEAHARG